MLNYILQFDTNLFYVLNGRLNNYILDFFMPFITTTGNFIWVLIFSWVTILILGNWQNRKTLILVVLCVLMSDFLTETLKHIVQRTRPCNILSDIRLLVGCTKSFSFPSGHATNAFAAAVYLSYTYRKYLPILFLFAILIAYSRIYVGVHYPIDVAVGALIGSIGAILVIKIDRIAAPILVSWFNKKNMIINKYDK